MVSIANRFSKDNRATLYGGNCINLLRSLADGIVDLVVTSPPYCMGKLYERPGDNLGTFFHKHAEILPEIYRVLKDGGSICWQVGYHVKGNEINPLDFMLHEVIKKCPDKTVARGLTLRNRLIWTFGHGHNATHRFSGRHEVIMWYTKGDSFKFNLDEVRIPQKYPGKRHYKGDKKGEYSGNPLGKNPSDVWDIPNVKSHHIEKTEHPCQFPVAIPQRLIRALTDPDDLVMDPFLGSGTTAVATLLEGRRFVGAESNKKYHRISSARIEETLAGTIRFRPDRPAMKPDPHSAVAIRPDHFKQGGLG